MDSFDLLILASKAFTFFVGIPVGICTIFGLVLGVIDTITLNMRETPLPMVSLQVPRPPGADDLYKGIYESFIEKGKDGRD